MRDKYGLLLTGGGARAAYQVGVLKAITHLLPRNQSIPFPIICGTSAGAINAVSLACFSSCFHLGVRKLEWVWKNFHTGQVYRSSAPEVFGYLLKSYIRGFRSEDIRQSAGSLLDNQPLRELLRKTLNFHRIDRNILQKHLKAISVTASSYSSHDSVSFFQSSDDLQAWKRAHRCGQKSILDIEHLMASAAIPLVFPCIQIGKDYFGDGSIHQLSPLSTPIHLGAEKILVIGVEQPDTSLPSPVKGYYPNSATIAGHLLDTIFADTLYADIERLQRVNNTLSLMKPEHRQNTKLKPVECMVINPSKNISDIASSFYDKMPLGIRMLLKTIGAGPASDSSLLSYLLFEGLYCKELINIGYQDGMAKQQELRQFLDL